MEASEAAYSLIKKWEGLKLKAYICPSGKWTIGWGHTRGVFEGMEITPQIAEAFLKQDVEMVVKQLNQSLSSVSLRQCQFDALVCFVFNIGITKFNTSTLRRLMLKDPESPQVGAELNKWVYGLSPKTRKMEKLPGLIKRRAEEAALYYSYKTKKA